MVGCIWKSLRGEVKRRYALLVGSAPRYWRLNLRLGGLVSETHPFALRSQAPDVDGSVSQETNGTAETTARTHPVTRGYSQVHNCGNFGLILSQNRLC